MKATRSFPVVAEDVARDRMELYDRFQWFQIIIKPVKNKLHYDAFYALRMETINQTE